MVMSTPINRCTVTLFRHAETEWSVQGRFAGVTDLELTAAGRASAQMRGLTVEPEAFDLAMVSPMRRAVKTAELLGFLDATVEPLLRERDYGAFEGLTTAEIQAIVPGWNVWADPVLKGEPLDEFVARVDQIVNRLKHADVSNVAVIAHAHWIRMFTARWLELAPISAGLFRLGELGEVRLGWERASPVMLGWNIR